MRQQKQLCAFNMPFPPSSPFYFVYCFIYSPLPPKSLLLNFCNSFRNTCKYLNFILQKNQAFSFNFFSATVVLPFPLNQAFSLSHYTFPFFFTLPLDKVKGLHFKDPHTFKGVLEIRLPMAVSQGSQCIFLQDYILTRLYFIFSTPCIFAIQFNRWQKSSKISLSERFARIYGKV